MLFPAQQFHQSRSSPQTTQQTSPYRWSPRTTTFMRCQPSRFAWFDGSDNRGDVILAALLVGLPLQLFAPPLRSLTSGRMAAIGSSENQLREAILRETWAGSPVRL